jgi:putative sterol carrier protein
MNMDLNEMNCRETLASLPERFDPAAAGSLNSEIQFHLTGQEAGDYFLHIGEGVCTFHEGQAVSPSITLTTPSEIWLQVLRQKLSGMEAFMQGKLRVEGDFTLGLRLFEIFHLR